MDKNSNRIEVFTYEEMIKYLNQRKKELECSSHMDRIRILKEIYQTCKLSYSKLYSDEEHLKLYDDIKDIIIACESLLGEKYLLPTKSVIIERERIHSTEEMLDFICSEVRKKILMNYQSFNPKLTSIDQIDVSDMCYMASKYTSDICAKYGIKCKRVRIDPGFDSKEKLFGGHGFHFFNIAQIDRKKYLIDLTYKQFFNIFNRNILSRMGVVGLAGCAPGVYMIQNEKRKELSERIIERGWIDFNFENIKNYFDGFALSARNGTYYEIMGSTDYYTEYTAQDYIRFLAREDSMFKHEPREGLGRQIKPLKNPLMNFEKK